MNEKDTLNTKESIDIITRMINQAKGNVAQSRFYILFWGWLVLIMSLGHFFLAVFTNYPYPFAVWSLSIIGVIVSFIYGYRESRQRKVTTFADTVYKQVWFSFIAIYFVLVAFMPRYNFYITPMVLLFASMATYLSGVILKFKPYRWGGLWIFLMAIVAFLLPGDWHPLASAFAVLFGYLVPGYMIKKQQ